MGFPYYTTVIMTELYPNWPLFARQGRERAKSALYGEPFDKLIGYGNNGVLTLKLKQEGKNGLEMQNVRRRS
jgi:hypothetical protein